MRRRRLTALAFVSAALALAFAALAAATSTTIKLKAQLNAGQEVPHQAVSGRKAPVAGRRS